MIKESYRQEASEKGLELVSEVDNSKYLYRRLACNHTFIADVANIRHQPRSYCKDCKIAEFYSHAEKRGLNLITLASGTKPDTYRVKSCGHILNLYRHNLFKADSTLRCPMCYEDRITTTLDSDNITELGCISSRRYLFRYNNCGHEFESTRHRIGSVGKCKTCFKLEETRQFSKVGVELINKTSAGQAVFKFKECGHERELHVSAVKRGNFVCHDCHATAWSYPSKFYILEFETNTGFKFIKFGYGKDIENRVREYKIKDMTLKELVFEFQAASGYSAMLVEKSIHKDFKEHLLDPALMRNYFTKGGYSECYNLDLVDKIKYEVITRYSKLSESDKTYIKHEFPVKQPQKVKVVVNRARVYDGLLEASVDLLPSVSSAYGMKRWVDRGFIGMVHSGYLFEPYNPELHANTTKDAEIHQITNLMIPVIKAVIDVDCNQTYLSLYDLTVSLHGEYSSSQSGFISSRIRDKIPAYGKMYRYGDITDLNNEILRRVLEQGKHV